MKVTLIATHQITKDEPIPLYGCIGILALAAVVKQRSYNCEVLDLVRYNNLDNQEFEPIANEIAGKIIETNPDMVGFSNTSDSLAITIDIAKRIKNISPKTCIILGGPGVSYCSGEILSRFKDIDYIIRGEADYAFPDFIAEYEANNIHPRIKGLVFRKNNKIEDFGWPDPVNDLDLLPIPAFEFCQSHEGENLLFDENFGYVIEAGRGCPYNCNFCSTSHYFNRKYRVKSVEKLIQEIKCIIDKCKNKRIRFSHDLLTFNNEYIVQLCDALQLHFPKLTWGCDSRLDTVDPNLLEKMSKAGCRYIYMGIESATPKMQKIIGKRLDLSRIDPILNSLKQWDYNFVFSFVVGLPEEDTSDIEAIFSMIMKTKSVCGDKCLIQIHLLRPEMGSRLFKENQRNLVYVEGTNNHDSAIALQWKDLRKTIKENPDLFPRFFTFKNKLSHYSSGSSDPSIYTYFVYIIQVIMKNSLLYSYRKISHKLSEVIVKCFDDAVIEGTNKFKEVDFGDLLESIREKTVELMGGNTYSAEAFNSIAKYEIAIFDLSKKRSENLIKTIEINYSEEEILDLVSNYEANIEKSGRKRHLMLLWDNQSEKVKSLEISAELAMLAGV